jgi:hypothetical protein
MRLKKSVRSKITTLVKKSRRFSARVGAVAIFLVVAGVGAAGMLIAAREPSREEMALSSRSPTVVRMTKVAADVTPANTIGSSAVTAPAAKKPVMLTGCLERHDKSFRLKDTSGADAPKSRSWKSGFLKKSSSSIDLVDASKTLKLTQHVGRRVRVSGTLVEREMQVSSLARVAASCN